MTTPTPTERRAAARRAAMHAVTDGEAYVLLALAGIEGDVAKLAAQLVVARAIGQDYVLDVDRIAAEVRYLVAEVTAGETGTEATR